MSSLGGLYIGIWEGIALLARDPHVAMDPAEARQWTEAAGRCLRHYPISTTQKAVDTAAFVGICLWQWIPRGRHVLAWRAGGAAAPAHPWAAAPAPIATPPVQAAPGPQFYPTAAGELAEGPLDGLDEAA